MELSIQCRSAIKIPLTPTPLLSSATRLQLPAFITAPSSAFPSSTRFPTLKSPVVALRRCHFIWACSRVDAAGTDPQLNKILQFSYPVAFITSFVTLFALVIAITKDLPDV